MQRSLIILKPEVLRRGLAGEIIARFERRGIRIDEMKLTTLTPEMASHHYQDHIAKPFFQSLIDYIISGPVVVMIVSGDDVVSIVRLMVGSTNPAVALPGTIRGDYATSISENIIHASDSIESAAREIAIFF